MKDVLLVPRWVAAIVLGLVLNALAIAYSAGAITNQIDALGQNLQEFKQYVNDRFNRLENRR